MQIIPFELLMFNFFRFVIENTYISNCYHEKNTFLQKLYEEKHVEYNSDF